MIKITTYVFLLVTLHANGQSEFKKAKQLGKESLNILSQNDTCTFLFEQEFRQFGHYSKPWETKKYPVSGIFMLAPKNEYYRKDSLAIGNNFYHGITFYNTDIIYQVDYGDDNLGTFSLKDRDNFLDEVARYTPNYYLIDFLNSEEKAFIHYKKGPEADTIRYRKHSEKIISLIIDKKTAYVSAIHVMYHHELWGDILKKINYSDYETFTNHKSNYPASITEEEFGVLLSTIHIKVTLTDHGISAIKNKIPPEYKLIDKPGNTPEVSYQKYNDYIHLLYFKEADDNVIIVEFKDFLLVVGAPLNSENGELVIRKAKEFIPGKTIKYFVFGHHHPYYLVISCPPPDCVVL